jgi:hypothetical protein
MNIQIFINKVAKVKMSQVRRQSGTDECTATISVQLHSLRAAGRGRRQDEDVEDSNDDERSCDIGRRRRRRKKKTFPE